MIFLLIHRSSPSKYSLRFLILPELVTIPKDPRAICRKDHIHFCIKKKDENYKLKPINSTRKVALLNLAETIERTNSVEQPNTSCVHIKLTFLLNVRSSWVIVQSKLIWNKPTLSNLTSDILRWKHLFRMHSLHRQSVYTTLSYCTEVRLKIRTKKTDLLRISIGSKAPCDRVSL